MAQIAKDSGAVACALSAHEERTRPTMLGIRPQPTGALGSQFFGGYGPLGRALDIAPPGVGHAKAAPVSKGAHRDGHRRREGLGATANSDGAGQGIGHGRTMQEFCMGRQPPSASPRAGRSCSIPAMSGDVHKRFVGHNLRVAIEAVATSQAAFARRVGVSPTKLGNWLRGDNYPDPLALVRACDEYGLTMDWFYRGARSGVVAAVAESLQRAEAASAAAGSAAALQAGES